MLRRTLALPLTILLLAAGLLMAGCSSGSLVTQKYEKDFYHIPRTLPDSLMTERPSFIVYGDTQSGWVAERLMYGGKWSWKNLLFPFYQIYSVFRGLIGASNWARGNPQYGADERAAVRKALVRAAARDDVSFLLHLGDIVPSNGRKASHWATYLRENRNTASPLETYPLLPTPGNHERANDPEYGWPNYRAVFDYPRFYVQDMPDAALFVLDSNYLLDQYRFIDDDQQDRLFERWFVSADTSTSPSWLERQLEKRRDRPFKMVAMHHPLITFSWHHADWRSDANGNDLLTKRDRLLRLLRKYDVQVVFSGHEHHYEHSVLRDLAPPGPKPLASSGASPEPPQSAQQTAPMPEGNDAPFLHAVISSGGGVPQRPVSDADEYQDRMADYLQRGFDVRLKKQLAAFHYTRVNVAPDTLTIRTFGIDPASGRRTGLIERIDIPAPSKTTSPSARTQPARETTDAQPQSSEASKRSGRSH